MVITEEFKQQVRTAVDHLENVERIQAEANAVPSGFSGMQKKMVLAEKAVQESVSLSRCLVGSLLELAEAN